MGQDGQRDTVFWRRLLYSTHVALMVWYEWNGMWCMDRWMDASMELWSYRALQICRYVDKSMCAKIWRCLKQFWIEQEDFARCQNHLMYCFCHEPKAQAPVRCLVDRRNYNIGRCLFVCQSNFRSSSLPSESILFLSHPSRCCSFLFAILVQSSHLVTSGFCHTCHDPSLNLNFSCRMRLPA